MKRPSRSALSRTSAVALVLSASLVASCSALSTTGEAMVRTSLAVGKSVNQAVNLVKTEKAGAENFSDSRRVPLHAENLDEDRLGQLLFKGGLEINSEDKDFGGLSGLLVSPDGTSFLAVSDKGFWVTGDLVSRKGELIGVQNIDVKRMRGLDGKKIDGKKLADAEALTGNMDGEVLVSFERTHRVWRYDRSGEKPHKAIPTPVELPPEVAQLKSNGGLEGITLLKDASNTLFIMSEETPDLDGNYVGWLVKRGGYFQISVKPMAPFKVTDLVTLPNGDVLTLERRFSPAGGPGYQIRRIPGDSIRPGAVLDGEVVATGAPPIATDNMEGLALRTDDHGNVILYIVSDDNYSPLQRTLLLSFRLMP